MKTAHGFCVIVTVLYHKYPWPAEVWVLAPWFAVCVAVSHGVVKHHVLFGQLQQHRIVEELADAHIFAQTLKNNKGC